MDAVLDHILRLQIVFRSASKLHVADLARCDSHSPTAMSIQHPRRVPNVPFFRVSFRPRNRVWCYRKLAMCFIMQSTNGKGPANARY